MNHYLRFVRSIAISSTVFACASGDTATQKQPQTSKDSVKETPAPTLADTADAGTDHGQDVADAAALVEADASVKPSGPLAPPELPSAFVTA
jgi:hypothetical protein